MLPKSGKVCFVQERRWEHNDPAFSVGDAEAPRGCTACREGSVQLLHSAAFLLKSEGASQTQGQKSRTIITPKCVLSYT